MELGRMDSNISEVFTVVWNIYIYIFPNPKPKSVLQRLGIYIAISCLLKLIFTVLRNLLCTNCLIVNNAVWL